jgi:hypothetical protein
LAPAKFGDQINVAYGVAARNYGARLVLLGIRNRVVSHLRRVAQLVQAFFDHMRLYQGGLQGNPNH